jgi:hypothetical protein
MRSVYELLVVVCREEETVRKEDDGVAVIASLQDPNRVLPSVYH